MNQGNKNRLGLLAFLPLIMSIGLLFYFLVSFVPSLLRMQQAGEAADAVGLLSRMVPVLLVTILAGLVHLAVLVYFIIHAISNQSLKAEERLMWILVFIFIGSLAFPLYWYLRLYRQAVPVSNFVRM